MQDNIIYVPHTIEGFVGKKSVILINFRHGKWIIDMVSGLTNDIKLAARYTAIQHEALTAAIYRPKG